MLIDKSNNGKQGIAATMSDSGSKSDALDRSARGSEPDGLGSASESSAMSSLSFCGHSRSPGRPRKRTAWESRKASQSRLKRVKSLYNDDYRTVFNSTVSGLAHNQSSLTDHSLHESQVGLIKWSSEEKAAFFRALARKGRHDIRGIATEIGSKSESEVHVYCNLLHEAAVNQQTYRSRTNFLNTSSLEAALEVQEDCCAALDLAAEALSALQQNEDEKAEKKEHKDLALLTPRIARRLERRLATPEGGMEEVKQHFPAATMLNLVNFLAISKRFFMNSTTAEDNWRSYTGRKIKWPSITYTAFSDFYALMISITQRLVQSSLFFAISRLKAMSASGQHRHGSHVRRLDVIAAINVLGMKTNAKSFWATAARKCKLRVYDKVRHRQVFGKRYSYAELERILSPSIFRDAGKSGMMTKHASAAISQKNPNQKDLSVSASEGLISSDSMFVNGGELNANSLSNNENLLTAPNRNNKPEDHDMIQDAYAEALDQQSSRDGERRLWEMLGKDPAEKMEPVNVKLPRILFPNQIPDDELLDWRKLVDYAEGWEKHETPAFESNHANDLGCIKDVGSATGLTSSESGSESSINDVIIEAEHNYVIDEDADSDGATKHSKAYASSGYDTKHGVEIGPK